MIRSIDIGKTRLDMRLPAYARLRDALAARIANGEWKVEQPLPSEARLARDFGVSVGTVRKAVDGLVSEGLLERRQGSGTFLCQPSFDATLFRFFQVRQPDGGAPSIPTSRLIARSIVTAPADIARILDTDTVIRIERLRGLSDQPILTEEIYLPLARFSGFESLPEEALGPLLYPIFFERFGVLVHSATDDLSFSFADDKTAQRLDIAVGDPVAAIERTAYAPDGTAVEWRRAHGSATRFRYRSTIA